ncbi:sulfite reduction-associated membrane complex, transmembrane b-type cytochrome subunit [Candidatus Desulfosporosinus infrequens]|uniref:Sulfite reduction-associated membrane complex, transmembrane b-type cytochrome subunit n=1 Tax=Candidatus Desulfosporosinus infrequens TaxID=2043169 RepID=A0A2U3LKT3_9FIRM|nr:sulfite reduction-associated membrane complex, transmembrane b-type cytochrome subunit [Candidatus Desulfosporosinus infrequens]
MLEKALTGSKKYWAWIIFLLVVIAVGFMAYLRQFSYGLGLTGMSRDVSWGLYIAQFTFLVGVAASAVMLVTPYYLHDFKKFGRMVIFGEFLAVSAVIMCILFIFVDVGQPMRILNVLLYPQLHSVMFYDMCVLCGYLAINIIVGWTSLGAERKGVHPPKWVHFLVYLSVPWAFSIHTVTAFLYAGLPGRHFWLTAIMAARFLASAFAAGPSLLIILLLIVQKVSKFDPDPPGVGAIQSLVKIIRYAMIANVFFYICEVFTAFYSGIPDEMAAFKYVFVGLDGHHSLVPFMWTATFLAFLGIALLIFPTRKNKVLLPIALLSIFFANWIDKGVVLIIAGFVPNSFDRVTEYFPTSNEISIVLGVYAIGFLLLTVLYKVAISVREEQAQ